MSRDVELSVATAKGEARMTTFPAVDPVSTLVLGHGAGGAGPSPDLLALAEQLPERGVTVVLVDQPWRVAGRKVAAAPAVLDAAWVDVLRSPQIADVRSGRLLVGGRSAGARVACRTAADVGADAVVALAFPLHPPGRPEKSRAAELVLGVPLLVVQGRSDAFGRPSEFPPEIHVVPVPGDHSLRRALVDIVAPVADFCR